MCDCKIPEDAFKVGDNIEFEYYTGMSWKMVSGEIMEVGNHGYWVDSKTHAFGTASIRCPFKSARKI